MPTRAAPTADLERVSDATGRFLLAVSRLSDEEVAGPSALPGWTVGHVLTHVARNADSHVRRAEAAVRGEVVDQYPGGFEGRESEIDQGAARSVRALLDDLSTSSAALTTAWSRVPDDAWGRISRDVGGRERPLSALPGRRWQELEVHVVDLGTAGTYRDWPADFVAVWLPRLEAGAGGRLSRGGALPGAGSLDDRERLAWLYGRARPPGFPELAPWS